MSITALCYVMLCYVMLCYVMLCYVMLCYVMLIKTNTGTKLLQLFYRLEARNINTPCSQLNQTWTMGNNQLYNHVKEVSHSLHNYVLHIAHRYMYCTCDVMARCMFQS